MAPAWTPSRPPFGTCDSSDINVVIGMGPSFLPEFGEAPDDFQDYPSPGYESIDGSGTMAKGTQEELLLWINHPDKGTVWKAQYVEEKRGEEEHAVWCVP